MGSPDTDVTFPNMSHADDGKVYVLQRVQILMRHGARTPVTNLDVNDFPNYEEANWDVDVFGKTLPETDVPVSVLLQNGEKPLSICDKVYKQKGSLKGRMLIGKLTTIGQRQSYVFGNQLKERYQHFLASCYDPKEIKIRSSDIERTIQSARCVLAGLYGKENIKEPLIMHTMKDEREFIYPNWVHCHKLYVWKQQINYVHCLPHVYQLTVEMNKVLGITDPERFMDLVAIDDLICCRKIHRFSVPKELLQNEHLIREGAAQIFTLILQGTDKVQGLRLSAGDLINELCENIETAATDKTKNWKMKVYSSHDSALMCLLMACNQWENDWPLFASYIILEHYKDQDKNSYVNFVFNGENLKLCEDNTYTPLGRFLEMLEPYRVRNSEENFPVK